MQTRLLSVSIFQVIYGLKLLHIRYFLPSKSKNFPVLQVIHIDIPKTPKP